MRSKSIRRIYPISRKYAIHFFALIFFMFITGLAVARLGQDVNYDLLNYHYSNPHSFLDGKTQTNIGVSGIQSYENPLRDIPAYLLMSNLSPKQAGVIIGALQGINLWLVFEVLYLMLRYMKVKRAGALSVSFTVACFTLLGSGFYSEIGTTMGDNTTSIPVLISLLLLIYSSRSAYRIFGADPYRFTSFALIGIAVGLKLTNLIYLFGIFAAGLVIKNQTLPWVKRLLVDGAAVSLGVLLSGGFWYIKMWLLFRNPIFPFYNGVFKSEYYPAENFIDSRWTNAPIWKALLEPFYYLRHQALSSEVSFKDPRLAIMIVTIIIVMSYITYMKYLGFHIKKWSREQTALLIFVAVSYIVWALQFSYYRYLIPVELLSLVVITVSIYFLGRKFWLSTCLVIGITAWVTVNTIQTSWGRVPWQPTNFGVTTNDFKSLEGAIVLMAGYQPHAFVIPYFPDSTTSLRIVSDLTNPGMGTDRMQNLLKTYIEYGRDERKPFYGLFVDEEKLIAEKAFETYGFRLNSCTEIPVTVRNHTPDKYRLCELQATSIQLNIN